MTNNLLPKGWKKTKIGNLVAEIRSGIASGEKSRDEGYIHLRMNNVSRENLLDLNLVWRIPATEKEISRYSLRNNDIIFNNTNSPELVGKCCLFNSNDHQAYLFSNHMSRIRTTPEITPQFLVYWINCMWKNGYFRDNCEQWVNQAAIRPEEKLFTQDIVFPTDIEEQKRFTNAINTKIRNTHNLKSHLIIQAEAVNALQDSILREAFPYSEGDKLPDRWKWEQLSSLSINLDGMRKPVTKSVRNKGDYPYYGASGIVDYVDDYIYDDDLLLVSEDGANLVARSTPIAFTVSGKVWVNNHAHVLKFDDQNIQVITERYLNYISLVDYLSGSAQPKLSKGKMDGIMIPVPPENERENIARKLNQYAIAQQGLSQLVFKQKEAVEALPSAILRQTFAFN